LHDIARASTLGAVVTLRGQTARADLEAKVANSQQFPRITRAPRLADSKCRVVTASADDGAPRAAMRLVVNPPRSAVRPDLAASLAEREERQEPAR
jgi:hypothetical protein